MFNRRNKMSQVNINNMITDKPVTDSDAHMGDLREVYARLKEMYGHYNEKMPVISEFIMEFRWFIVSDTENHISMCLRVGQEKSREEYDSILRDLIGKPADMCVEELFAKEDVTLRTIVHAILNLMSKPFNTAERLQDRGIERKEGLQFPYDPAGKKVGIVGYGLYNNFFLGKCAEFHAFDLRPEKSILSYRISKEKTDVYPQGIHWHLGKNAAEFADDLAGLDIVIITGCTIVNDSYRTILDCCKNAQVRGLYGPSNELCPDYLFDLGFNYIFSASVTDKETYLAAQLAPLPEGMDLKFMDKYVLTRA